MKNLMCVSTTASLILVKKNLVAKLIEYCFLIHSWMITEKWAELLKFFIIKYFITSFSSILSLEPGLNYTYHLDACFTFQPG